LHEKIQELSGKSDKSSREEFQRVYQEFEQADIEVSLKMKLAEASQA